MSTFETSAQYADNALIEPHLGPRAWVPLAADQSAGCCVVIASAASRIGVLVESHGGSRSDTAARGTNPYGASIIQYDKCDGSEQLNVWADNVGIES